MPAHPHSEVDFLETIAALTEHGGITGAAQALGVPYATMQSRARKARLWREAQQTAGFEVADVPPEVPPIDELLERRRKTFQHKHKVEKARHLIPVQVTLDGPVGIAHFGDPHIDDDGTNLPLLLEHIEIIEKTSGLFAGNVGDNSNNWIGRLARLYGQQSTSAAEAWALTEWLVSRIPWLYLIGGNHDVWSGAGDPIHWIAKFHGTLYQWYGARLELKFPNGNTCRINARHDFQGHSQWNTAHGPAKAAMIGWRDHILTCGHKHTSGYQMVRDPASGLISHALRVGTYKVYDHYAQERGLPNQNSFCCPVTIIDPQYPHDDVRFITVIFDPREAAEYLTWKRQRTRADAVPDRQNHRKQRRR